jgi:hypothetical protein
MCVQHVRTIRKLRMSDREPGNYGVLAITGDTSDFIEKLYVAVDSAVAKIQCRPLQKHLFSDWRNPV